MFILTEGERIKRGCEYCTNMSCEKNKKRENRQGKRKIYLCKFSSCPFHELDNVVTYSLYLATLCKDFDIEILLKEKDENYDEY